MSSVSEPTIAQQLAGFVAGLRYEDLPAEVVNGAKALVLDQLACELIGSTMPWVAPAKRLVQLTEGAKRESTIVGSEDSCLAGDAAFVNASYGQACELDDSSFGSAGHIGTATVPVALSMGERERIDGRRFLVAIVAGYEVMYRLMRSLRPYHNSRGFHSQSIGGPFASAAVAGKILGLDADRMTHALAIAGSHACGPVEYDQSGGEVKRLHAGIPVRGGMMAVLYAQRGVTGPATILEGLRGIPRAFGGLENVDAMADDLTKQDRYAIEDRIVKPYPTLGAMHTAIQAMARLMHEHPLRPEQVAEIHVRVNALIVAHGGAIVQPQDIIGAQFSLAFSLALRLVKGSNDLRDYMNPELWKDPQIVALAEKVQVRADPGMVGDKRFGARVDVVLVDGGRMSAEEPYRKGSAQLPFSPEELSAKYRRLASAVLTDSGARQVEQMVHRLEEVRDVSEFAGLLLKS